MAHRQLRNVLRFIRGAAGPQGCGDATDVDLLGRFAAHREEAAFEALLRRHGPMVLGVCRRMLGDAADADDAFQATFLVLARKAASIRKTASAAGWLHGVARRVALESRTRAARRRVHERRVEGSRSADPSDAAAGRELQAILDEELERLPEKYRSPLVLHYLEGKTKGEAARQLGWTEGTVSGRLARARELLRGRLCRRGLALSAGALATALASKEATAAVPALLAEAVLHTAAISPAAGAGAARVASLAERAVRAMWLTKVRTAAAVLLAAAAVGLGAGGMVYWARAESPAAEPQPRPAAAKPPADPALAKKEGPLLRVPAPMLGTTPVALTADGKILATAGPDNTVQLFDVASGKELHTLKGHTLTLTVLAFSPDGKTLASATGSWLPDGAPGEIKVWDVAAGKELSSPAKLPTMVVALAFSPDGKKLATVSRTVKVWDAASGKEVADLPVKDGNSAAFAPDGKTLAVGRGVWEDKTPGFVALWDTTTWKERTTMAGHVGMVAWVAYSPDGKTLASADSRGTVKLWDAAAAKERATVRNPTSSFLFQSTAFTADGKTLAATMEVYGKEKEAGGFVVKEWDAAGGEERATYRQPHGDGLTAFSADAKTVAFNAVAEKVSVVEVWDLQSLPAESPEAAPSRPKPPPDPAGRVVPLEGGVGAPVLFSPDGKRLAGGNAKTLCIWKTVTGKLLQTTNPPGGAGGLIYSVHGRLLAVADGVIGPRFCPDGSWIAGVPASPAPIVFRDAETGEVVRTLDGVEGATGDGDVMLWNMATGKALRPLEGSAGAPTTYVFSPDSKFVAGVTREGQVKLWEVATGKAIRSLGQARCVAYSPDGRKVAGGGPGSQLWIWDAATGKQLLTIPETHESGMVELAFSPDGKRLITAGTGPHKQGLLELYPVQFEGQVKVWDAGTGKELLAFGTNQIGNLDWACVAPDGEHVLTNGGWDKKTMLLWSLYADK